MKRTLAIFLCTLMLLGLLAGCGSKSANESYDTSSSYGINGDSDYDPKAPASNDEGYWDGGDMSYDVQESESANIPRDTKMIYRANLDLETTDYDTSENAIRTLVKSCGGYFESKSLNNGSRGYRYGEFTVRVPSGEFEHFCSQIGELCHVTYQSSSAENITEDYYDVDSRLKTAQIKLERLQELLKKAESMEDIITIESAISETEYEIEDLSGTMRHYDALVGYATVDLELSEVYRLSGTEDAPKSFGEKLANAFTDGLAATGQTLEDFAVWLAYSWLDVLIFAAVVFVAVKLIGQLRRGKKLPKPVRKKKNAETPADETKTEE